MKRILNATRILIIAFYAKAVAFFARQHKNPFMKSFRLPCVASAPTVRAERERRLPNVSGVLNEATLHNQTPLIPQDQLSKTEILRQRIADSHAELEILLPLWKAQNPDWNYPELI